MGSPAMARLALLTEMLPDLEHLSVPDDAEPRYVEYEMVSGYSHAVNVYRDKSLAIARAYFSPDAEFKLHVHDEVEIAVFYEGEGVIILDGQEVPIVLAEPIKIEPGKPHAWRFSRRSQGIFLTIPPAPGYP